jgi:outer membrane murein-binding lipoprotein Lpp
MSDTPETDKIAHAGLPERAYISEMTHKARKLERERDEARKERNAALSDRDAWARLCGAVDCYTPSTAEPYEALKLQRDALRAEVNQLKAERDNWRVSSVCRELNAELERLKAELAAMKGDAK